jgi:hypothetical protein
VRKQHTKQVTPVEGALPAKILSLVGDAFFGEAEKRIPHSPKHWKNL